MRIRSSPGGWIAVSALSLYGRIANHALFAREYAPTQKQNRPEAGATLQHFNFSTFLHFHPAANPRTTFNVPTFQPFNSAAFCDIFSHPQERCPKQIHDCCDPACD
jgi:hypothetical protein